jgi:hypothetical protein
MLCEMDKTMSSCSSELYSIFHKPSASSKQDSKMEFTILLINPKSKLRLMNRERSFDVIIEDQNHTTSKMGGILYFRAWKKCPFIPSTIVNVEFRLSSK